MTYRIPISFLIAALAAGGLAQTPPQDLVVQALANSQAVAARQLEVQEAEQIARSLGSPKNPELEVAPGIGFTNSNFVLGQSFDLSGQRAASAQRARAEVNVARAGLRRAQLLVTSETLTALASYQAAVTNEANARSGLEIAKATLDAIRKRIEVGEAPALQATRAEVEFNRAEQALVLARSDLATQRAALNSLLGKSPTDEIPALGWLPEPSLQALTPGASTQRPEALEALARIDAARASEVVAKRQGSPSFFAGIAADTWSMDRKTFQRDNVGLQIRLTMPLFDQGENRHAVRAAESARKAREAELKDVQRRIGLEIENATTQVAAAREVAKSYETGIVPKAEQMVKAMQNGLEAGLTNFLDVLEAQRTLAQLRREASEALRNVHLAEVRFLAAVGYMPGMEAKP